VVLLAGDARSDDLAQLADRQADVEVEERAPVHLVHAQAPQVLGAAVPDEHIQVLVHHHRGGAHAGEHRLDERVQLVQLLGALA
jgi:hypothetical protein